MLAGGCGSRYALDTCSRSDTARGMRKTRARVRDTARGMIRTRARVRIRLAVRAEQVLACGYDSRYAPNTCSRADTARDTHRTHNRTRIQLAVRTEHVLAVRAVAAAFDEVCNGRKLNLKQINIVKVTVALIFGSCTANCCSVA